MRLKLVGHVLRNVTALLGLTCLIGIGTATAVPSPCSSGVIGGRVYRGIDAVRFSTSKLQVKDLLEISAIPGAGDFDGDGRDDILIVTTQGVPAIAYFNDDLGIRLEPIDSSDLPFQWESAAVGDFNGDGLADIIGPQTSRAVWGLALRRRDAPFEIYSISSLGNQPTRPRILPLDFNCDGALDLFIQYPGSLWNTKFAKQGAAFGFDVTAEYSYRRSVRGVLKREKQCDAVAGQLFEDKKSWVILTNASVDRAWATFPELVGRWNDGWVLDLNGDTFNDILVTSEHPLFNTWAAISNGRTGIERSIPSPFDAERQLTVLAAGDFNGDGLDDLLASSSDRQSTWIALTSIGEPLAFTKVTLSSGASAMTSADGLFRFEGLEAGVYSISVQHDDLEFQNNSREVKLKACQRVITQFGAVPQRRPNAGGAVERFGAEPVGPYLCHGYSPNALNWKWNISDLCAEQFAAYAADDPSRSSDARNIRIAVSCCKLPSPDILEGPIVDAGIECPVDHIVIGARNLYNPDEHLEHPLVCAKINTARYQLGEATAGTYWGLGNYLRSDPDRIHLSSIPEAIRLGIHRWTFELADDSDGCIGRPPGSLLVAKHSPECRGLVFRQLQYKGNPGDPPQGTPVEMFPKCAYIENPFDPTTECVLEKPNQRH